jgi:hypothetical protein
MNQTNDTAPGIDVHEQPLNQSELGFISGMYEALANRTMTEAEFRLLLAQVTDQDS